VVDRRLTASHEPQAARAVLMVRPTGFGHNAETAGSNYLSPRTHVTPLAELGRALGYEAVTFRAAARTSRRCAPPRLRIPRSAARWSRASTTPATSSWS
jgi:hypothetical protein